VTLRDAYLARISYDGPRTPTAEVLRALQERHLLSVPFENLDIHWKRPIVVDTERFLHKIIEERRGGFCYELNGAFAWLLRELGFDVQYLSGRVPTRDGGIGPPFDHMALLVTIDGTRWLSDVGFGEFSLHPLEVDGDNGEFEIVQGDDEWEIRRNGELEYRFTLEPHELHEFAPMCDYQQFDPRSHFTQRRICSIATPEGRITLAADVGQASACPSRGRQAEACPTFAKLIVTRNGERTETPVAAEEWENVLRETFGIAPC
jgi:N-hydroxyarylamine O-acetyltransferase